MAWLGVADGPLIAIRALHFAASAMTTGAVVFGAVVGKPALGSEQPLAKLQGKLTLALASVGLAITVVSGVVWFVVQAAKQDRAPRNRPEDDGGALGNGVSPVIGTLI